MKDIKGDLISRSELLKSITKYDKQILVPANWQDALKRAYIDDFKDLVNEQPTADAETKLKNIRIANEKLATKLINQRKELSGLNARYEALREKCRRKGGVE